MATISSHTLNAVDGTHAGGIAVALYRIGADDRRHPVFVAEMDSGGRLSREIPDSEIDTKAQYELVLQTGAYFAARNLPHPGPQIVRETVVRFAMPDPAGRYHVPMILAPNGHSMWWSS